MNNILEDLINISNFCSTLLVKHGEVLHKCNAVYIKDEDIIEFRIEYRFKKGDSYRTYQYQIENFNFLITDIEVLVNKTVINILLHEVYFRLNLIPCNG